MAHPSSWMDADAMIDFRANFAAHVPPQEPLDFELTPAEREAAAFAQAQLRMDAMKRNAADAALLAFRAEAAHA